MKNISIIVAIAKNNAIGKDNKLLWHISDDLKRFKKLTTGKTIIMGRNTYLSLPNGALPNRENIVISDTDEIYPDVIIAKSIEDAIEKANDDIFIIGGGMIYKQFLPLADRLYLTTVDEDFDGDVFFPEISYDEFVLIDQETIESNKNNEYAHTFSIYYRKK